MFLPYYGLIPNSIIFLIIYLNILSSVYYITSTLYFSYYLYGDIKFLPYLIQLLIYSYLFWLVTKIRCPSCI